MRRAAERWAPWVAGLVLLAGVASYTATRLAGGNGPGTPAAATVGAPQPTVPLDPGARAVARQFVATAVARRRLARAWELAGPTLRGHLSRAEWLTGNIPVLPYPVAEAAERWAVKASHPGDALLAVTFVPRQGSAAASAAYVVGLAKLGGRWVVDSYTPASSIVPGR